MTRTARAFIALILIAGLFALAGCGGGARACGQNRQSLTGAVASWGADNEVPTTIDKAFAQKLIDAKYLNSASADELVCPDGGTYTMGGDFGGQVMCSKHN